MSVADEIAIERGAPLIVGINRDALVLESRQH
jgi:hypothetical protein